MEIASVIIFSLTLPQSDNFFLTTALATAIVIPAHAVGEHSVEHAIHVLHCAYSWVCAT